MGEGDAVSTQRAERAVHRGAALAVLRNEGRVGGGMGEDLVSAERVERPFGGGAAKDTRYGGGR